MRKKSKMFKLCKMTIRAGFVVLITLAMVFASSYAPSQVLAAGTAPSLGAAESFGVLGAQAVTNTGSSVITGDLGIWPKDASSISGFPPGSYTGALHAADEVAHQAQSDVTAAYGVLAALPFTHDLSGQNLGGLTLVPGVYHFDTSAQLTGTLTLDAQNSTDSVFIFQIGSTLTTASNSSVVVINAPPNFCNKYWQVGSSATLGTYTTFQGNILALESITLNTGASLYGRALARNAAVTMDNNAITIPVCGVAPLQGTLEIFKFNDLNGNGVQDQPGETPLANWHYTITGPGGYSSSGDTDGSGLIVKTGLVPGDYNVTETAQAGWIVTTANSQTGTVPAGGGKRLNFGNRELVPSEIPGTLEIFKFNDLNGDGIYEPGAPDFETPLQSWNFTVAGGPTPTPGPYSTGVDGLITISNLTAGDYTVTETILLNWTVTTANPQTGTVPAGGGKRLNFGNVETVPVPPGTLEIFKFNDLNGNGVYDPSGETPLANWHYTITGPGGYSSYGTTNASGLIIKTGLEAGDYNVTETAQAGWIVTTANSQTGTVPAGGGKRLNFGNRQPGILQIFKFNDLNGNGVYNPPGETPMANWHYTITGPGGYSSSGDTDNLGLLTKTSLEGLVPGNYTVTETVQAGWNVTTDNPQTEMVPAGGGKRLDFGNVETVPVGGEVYPINKVKLLMPWIVLFTAVLAGASIVARRRLRSYR